MAFWLTGSVDVGDYKNIPISELKYKLSVSNFVDTCVIKLPLQTALKRTQDGTVDFSSNELTVFKEGDFVSVSVGYNKENSTRFIGFVDKIDYSIPLVLNCEGYSYQLKRKVFSKSYKSVTLRALLDDLIVGTDIVLSEFIPDVTFKKLTFKNAGGLQVLDWLKKTCLCTVYFDASTLYVGPSKYAVPKPLEKLLIGWNTVNADSLKKSDENNDIEINLIEKDSAGTVKTVKAEEQKYSNTKEVKVRAGLPDSFLSTLQKELQDAQNFKSYEGGVMCFLEPFFDKGYAVDIADNRYPERAGKYFVETVEGSLSKKGGRQNLILKHYAD